MSTDIEFDDEKDAINRAKHGLPLSFAVLLFEGDYKEKSDDRQNYGETRINVLGFIKGGLYFCAYTWRGGTRRIITLRKANRREINGYYKD